MISRLSISAETPPFSKSGVGTSQAEIGRRGGGFLLSLELLASAESVSHPCFLPRAGSASISCGYKRRPLSRTPPVPSMTWYGALVEYIEISDCSKAEAAQSRPLATLTSFLPPGCAHGMSGRGATHGHTSGARRTLTSIANSTGQRAHGRLRAIPDTNRAARRLAWWQCDAPRFHFRMIFEVDNQGFGSPVMCWTARCGARALLGGWKLLHFIPRSARRQTP